jgi:chaperone required for assembly of F1-ATPase
LRSGVKPVLLAAVVGAQVDVVDDGSFVEGNSLPFGDLVKCAVDCGEMVEREIADEDALNFVIADAAVHPAEEDNKLRTEGQSGEEQGQWCGEHGSPGE